MYNSIYMMFQKKQNKCMLIENKAVIAQETGGLPKKEYVKTFWGYGNSLYLEQELKP